MHTTPCHLDVHTCTHHTVVTPHPATVTWTPAVTTRHVPCHLDAHTCSDHTTSCHLDMYTYTCHTGVTPYTPCHLDVHTRAVSTPHPVTWMCTHLQFPHHTLSPGAMTCTLAVATPHPVTWTHTRVCNLALGYGKLQLVYVHIHRSVVAMNNSQYIAWVIKGFFVP